MAYRWTLRSGVHRYSNSNTSLLQLQFIFGIFICFLFTFSALQTNKAITATTTTTPTPTLTVLPLYNTSSRIRRQLNEPTQTINSIKLLELPDLTQIVNNQSTTTSTQPSLIIESSTKVHMKKVTFS